MDYSRRALADRLAAEHVLGTLRGPARRRFDALLPAHPVLRQAVAAWQARLLPLTAAVAPVVPSEAVWAKVQQRLFSGPAATSDSAVGPWWRRVALWQGVSALASVAVVSLAVRLAQPPPVQAPIVVVMAPTPQAAGVLQVGFAAGIAGDGRALVVQPIQSESAGAGRSFQLWAVPAQGAPRSLGLVDGRQATTVRRDALLQDTAAFAVSLEPAGGSPTGAPTGPIISVGKLGGP
jgi:anti-sigma-K factor RskA